MTHSSLISVGSKKASIAFLFVFAVLFIVLPFTAFGADKLKVIDSGGVNPGFVVTDDPKMGVGTATPWATLHVASQDGSNTNRGIISSQHYNGTTAAITQFERSRGTLTAPTALSSGDAIGAFHFLGYDGTNYQTVSSIVSKVSGSVSAGSVPGQLFFYTGTNSTTNFSAPKMVIATSGNVGIGTASPAYLLDVAGQARINGLVYGSSRTLKDNIKDLQSSDAMEALKNLNPVTFSYKADNSEKHVGFIAEDVPALVAKNGRKGIDPMDIVAVLTKVVQQQQQTISDLKTQMTELQKEVKLKNGFAALETK